MASLLLAVDGQTDPKVVLTKVSTGRALQVVILSFPSSYTRSRWSCSLDEWSMWSSTHTSKRNQLKFKYCQMCKVINGWIKRDQLDVTCFNISLFNAQHVSDVNTSILRSLRLICWVISWVVLLWYDMCWCYVVVWLGWCGIRIPHHPSQTTT